MGGHNKEGQQDRPLQEIQQLSRQSQTLSSEKTHQTKTSGKSVQPTMSESNEQCMAAVERTLLQQRRGNQVEITAIAKQVGQTEVEVRQAVAVLVERGLVYATDSHVMLLS